MAYRQEAFTAHRFGYWKSKIKASAWRLLVRVPLVHSWCLLPVSSHGRKASGSLWSLFYEALIPFMKDPPLCPEHFPKALPSNTVTLGIRISAYEFWGDTHIQTIAATIQPGLFRTEVFLGV